MSENINALEIVMESDSFRRFAPLFLEEPITFLEAEKRCGISRQTIAKQLGRVNEYVDQPKWTTTVKGRPLRLRSKIITDYLALKLKLEEKDKSTLDELVENEKINPVIVKGNETIETAITKSILSVLLIGVLRYHISKETDVSLSFVDSLFGDFLRSKVLSDKKPRKTKKKEERKIEALKAESFKFVYSSLADTEEDFNNYELELQKLAEQGDDKEFDKYDILIHRLRHSKLPIITYPNTWYDVLGFTIEPSLQYTKRLKNPYQQEDEKVYLSFMSSKERKKFKEWAKIRDQKYLNKGVNK